MHGDNLKSTARYVLDFVYMFWNLLLNICGLKAIGIPQLIWKYENKTLIYVILKISVPKCSAVLWSLAVKCVKNYKDFRSVFCFQIAVFHYPSIC